MSTRHAGALRLADEAVRRAIVIDLYCRISKDYDGTLRSVEDQEAMGRAWIAEHAHLGYVLGEVHRDHALSAWNPKVKRAAFNRLMARLESGAAQGLWVRDLDRFSRKMDEAERLVRVAKAGAVIVARHSSYDFSTARGIKSFREDAVDAAYESDRISERTSRGKASRKARGKGNESKRGFGRPGYLPNPPGWMAGDPRTPVPADRLAREIRAVREAAASIIAGGSMSDICRAWNAEGLYSVSGVEWDVSSLRTMFESPAVGGMLTDRETGEVIRDDVEGPLDRATWERLMLNFASRRRGAPATEHLLSGLLWCAECGGRMYGSPLKACKPYPDGSVRRNYVCQRRIKAGEGCGRTRIDGLYADEFVRALVLARVGDPRHVERVQMVSERRHEARRAILKELSDLNAEIDSVTAKTGTSALWTAARVNKALENFEPLVADAQARLDALGDVEDDSAHIDAMSDWEAANLDQRRALIRRAVPEGVYVKRMGYRKRDRPSVDRFVVGEPEALAG